MRRWQKTALSGSSFSTSVPHPRSGRLSRRPQRSRGTSPPSLRAPGFSAASPVYCTTYCVGPRTLPQQTSHLSFCFTECPNGLSSQFGQFPGLYLRTEDAPLSIEDDSPQCLFTPGEGFTASAVLRNYLVISQKSFPGSAPLGVRVVLPYIW